MLKGCSTKGTKTELLKRLKNKWFEIEGVKNKSKKTEKTVLKRLQAEKKEMDDFIQRMVNRHNEPARDYLDYGRKYREERLGLGQTSDTGTARLPASISLRIDEEDEDNESGGPFGESSDEFDGY